MQSEPKDRRCIGRRATIAALAGLLVLAIALLAVWQMREPAAIAEQKTERPFQPVRVIPAQPAIQSAPFIAASKVRGQVSDNELVLGVVIDDEARAYPINMLTGPSREIINDTVAGKPVAATW